MDHHFSINIYIILSLFTLSCNNLIIKDIDKNKNLKKFEGENYVSYQFDDIRVYIPYYGDNSNNIDTSCNPSKQLEYLFEKNFVDGYQFMDLIMNHYPQDSFLKKDLTDFSNDKYYENDYEKYKGRIVFFEAVYLNDDSNKTFRTFRLLVNTTGWSPGPVNEFELRIYLKGQNNICDDFINNIEKVELSFTGIML